MHRLRSLALAATACAVIATEAAAASPRIRLAAGFDFVPSTPVAAASRPAEPGEPSRARGAYLVQFLAPPGRAERDAITSVGGSVIAYVPDQAFLVRMSGTAVARLGARPGIAWVGDYEPRFKLSPRADRSSREPADFTVLLFPDADLDATRRALETRGLVVSGGSDNGINKLLRLRSAGTALADVAAIPDVAWIEPATPMTLFNLNAQWVTQTNAAGNRRVWDQGLRGQGQVLDLNDSGIATAHDQFRDPLAPITGFGDYPAHRKLIAYRRGSDDPAVAFGDEASAGFHGTATACSFAGDDAPTGASPCDGMAKEARIFFMDLTGPSLGNFVSPPADLNDLLLPPYLGNAGGAARISSNSWGGYAAGAYTLDAYEVDQFAWTHPDCFVAFAAGNTGPGPQTIASPATAKNVAAIGGVQNAGLGGFYSATGRGPTADGRRKPTFCAPAVGLISAAGANPSGYSSFSGTSMAAPCAAGTVALMRQYLTEGWYPTGAPVAAHAITPSAALLRAMAINSSLETAITGHTAPDDAVGWGLIDADNVLYFLGDTRRLVLDDHAAGLVQGDAVEYRVVVADASQPLEVTLAWTDRPGHPAAAIQLVNDLDLVVSGDTATYRGNVFAGAFSKSGGARDDRNVEETVRVPTPSPGIWTIRIEAHAVPIGPQPFALVITGGVGGTAGMLALDRATCSLSDSLEIEVIDANAGSSVALRIVSGTETAPEWLTLTGVAGVYRGRIAVRPVAPDPGDGVLAVSDGDDVTVAYADADPAATLVATARVAAGPPVITGVTAAPSGDGCVTVRWTTDIAATSRVEFGLTPALEAGGVSDSSARLAHAVEVCGLVAGATYSFDVVSVSATGAAARDDLGGAHHRVTARGPGDVLLVFGEPVFERAFAWQDALAASGVTFDTWSGEASARATLGDRSSGLRSYHAVIWQPGFDQAPPFSDAQRDTLTAYLAGGGRLAVAGHDVARSLGDPASRQFTPARRAWLATTLKTVFVAERPTWDTVIGVPGDSVSGAMTGGIPYAPVQGGAAGDEIAPAAVDGNTVVTWSNGGGAATPAPIGLRWESAVNDGDPATALWGGLPSRLAAMYFEPTALAPPATSPSPTRDAVVDATLRWLIGRATPSVTLVEPHAADTLVGASATIAWIEAAGAGRHVVSRALERSLDDGASWSPIAADVAPSPYAWSLGSTPNAAAARVRIRVEDDGVPPLSATAVSPAFRIARAGGDTHGPVVVAGSLHATPLPIVRERAATLTARVSDEPTGGAAVTAAEWSAGAAPASAGSGVAMTGAWNASNVEVGAALPTAALSPGTTLLWVRGRDAAGQWGPAAAIAVPVRGSGTTDIGSLNVRVAFLGAGVPNPLGESTELRFGLPARGRASLAIFDVQGRRVRRLVAGDVAAGAHAVAWNRRGDRGERVAPGVYFVRLDAPGARLTRRIVVL